MVLLNAHTFREGREAARNFMTCQALFDKKNKKDTPPICSGVSREAQIVKPLNLPALIQRVIPFLLLLREIKKRKTIVFLLPGSVLVLP